MSSLFLQTPRSPCSCCCCCHGKPTWNNGQPPCELILTLLIQAPVALLLVDIQNDFMEKGSLAVPNASQIMPAVLRLINDTKDRIVVASKVCHHGYIESPLRFELVEWIVHGIAYRIGIHPTISALHLIMRISNHLSKSNSSIVDVSRSKSFGLHTAWYVDPLYKISMTHFHVCIQQGSTGAELAKDILSGRIDYIVNKVYIY